jgi:hypothetical protein
MLYSVLQLMFACHGIYLPRVYPKVDRFNRELAKADRQMFVLNTNYNAVIMH